jgi:adenylosuccinate lyase
MRLVATGVSRQTAHEEIRVLSHQAGDVVKRQGGKNDLIERIKKSEFFRPVWADVDGMLDPKNFIGRCPEQVMRFCGEGGEVQEALKEYKKYIGESKAVQLTI